MTFMKITSEGFKHGDRMPVQFTRDGQNVSPALKWSDLPAGTKELALICDDPVAPMPHPFVHWVAYKIDPSAGGLPQGIAKGLTPGGAIGAQGKNDFGDIGYDGPEPPRGHGMHHYHFRLYALDTKLDAKPGLDKNGLLALMEGHILQTATLTGTYERS